MREIDYALREKVGLQYLLDGLAPASPYGAERVRRLACFERHERAALERAWRNVRAAMDGLTAHTEAYDRLARLMMQMRDIRGTLARCEETALTEIELFEVKRFLLQLAQLAPLYAQIGGAYEGIDFTEEAGALALLDPEGKRAGGFAISGLHDRELIAIRDGKRQLELRLRNTPEGTERDTLLNERRLVVAKEEAQTLKARARLTQGLRPHAPALLRNAEMIGELDLTVQKAQLARKRGMTMPTIVEDDVAFEAMENPQVADGLAAKGARFTRVSLTAPLGATVITGANMGGKSVAMRTLALNVLLCQAGFFACAASAALPLFDGIHLVSEDLTDVGAGLSSFGAEVVRIQAILTAVEAGALSLVLLDEPARGTNPREGAALVRALVRRAAGLHAITVFATHYDGAAAFAQAHYQSAGLRGLRGLPDTLPAGDRLSIIASHMDYGLLPVARDKQTPQEALTICRLLGLDAQVVADMEATLDEDALL